jgi:dienelactone hydrolase
VALAAKRRAERVAREGLLALLARLVARRGLGTQERLATRKAGRLAATQAKLVLPV